MDLLQSQGFQTLVGVAVALLAVGASVAFLERSKELESLAAGYPDCFKVYYVLNQPPEVRNGGVGFVSKDMIQTRCPAPGLDIQILWCGPPRMNKAMAAHLESLGYSPEMQFQF